MNKNAWPRLAVATLNREVFRGIRGVSLSGSRKLRGGSISLSFVLVVDPPVLGSTFPSWLRILSVLGQLLGAKPSGCGPQSSRKQCTESTD